MANVCNNRNFGVVFFVLGFLAQKTPRKNVRVDCFCYVPLEQNHPKHKTQKMQKTNPTKP